MAELTGKAISELPESTTVNNAALVALSDNGASKKMTLATLVGNLLKKTGDTMTGIYRFKGSNLDKDVAADSWSDSYPVVVDKDGDFLGNVRAFTLATGVSGVQLTGQNGSYQNSLKLGETANNEHYVSVSAPGTWRTALNTINKAGDTMTGNLTLSGTNAGVFEDTTAYEIGVPPANDTYTIGLRNRDKNGTLFGAFNSFLYANGQIGTRIMTQRGNVTNQLRLIIDGNGNQIVSVSDQGAWRKALGLCYAVNDTFNPSYAYTLAGHITSSSTTIYFDVEVPKSLENISTVSITTLTGTLRGVSGYLDNNSADVNFKASPYTLSAAKISNNRVRITITKSTAFTNVVNNSPVAGFMALSLKFT